MILPQYGSDNKSCLSSFEVGIKGIVALFLASTMLLTSCGQKSAPVLTPDGSTSNIGQVTIPSGIHGLGEGWDTEEYASQTGYYCPILE